MCVSYFVHTGFGVFLEVGVTSWGRRRADVVCLKINGDIVIVEVKSCLADFRTDNKWQDYLRHSNKFYFCFPKPLDVELPDGVGVLVPDSSTGYLRVHRPAKRRKMQGRDKRNLVLRLAWRAATFSKRTIRKRTRIYL